MGRSHLTEIAWKFRTQRAFYFSATTQAGPADEYSPHRSHMVARHDPKEISSNYRVRCRTAQQAISSPSTFTCARFFEILAHVNVLGPDRPKSARFGPFRTVSPFVGGSPDHANNVQTGRRDLGVIGTSRSHWLARTCARRARVVKTDPNPHCAGVVVAPAPDAACGTGPGAAAALAPSGSSSPPPPPQARPPGDCRDWDLAIPLAVACRLT